MRRSILLAFIAALALTVGFSTAGLAADGGQAQSSAKKKGRACKSKNKGKGNKGKRSASASRKKKGCKAKGKGRSGSGSWPPGAGTYEGQDGIDLRVTAGGKQAAIIYSPPFGSFSRTCLFAGLEFPPAPATSTASSFRAGAQFSGANGLLQIKWSLDVTPGFRYKLEIDSSLSLPEQKPCNMPGAQFRGTFTKQG